MANLITNAILLRYANYKDFDRMLTLFSPTLGKIDVLARGCRRPKSSLLNACELFSTGEYVLYQTKDRYILTNATVHESFYPLRMDYPTFTQGVYLLNLTEAAIQFQQPFEDLFRLLIKTLNVLAYGEENSATLLGLFLFHYANLLGYKPRLLHCIYCESKVSQNDSIFFDYAGGGVVCKSCNQIKKCPSLTEEHYLWLLQAVHTGPQNAHLLTYEAPFSLLKKFVEFRLDFPVKSGDSLVL